MPHDTVLTDGSFSFSGGCDASKPTTVESAITTDGLSRNEISWGVNCIMRDGGIMQRTGWQPVGKVHDGTSLYQFGYMYEPVDNSNPYLVFSIGGEIIKYDPTTLTVTNLSTQFGISNPPLSSDQAFFRQGEEFLVIQAGDGVTLPLFWDGAILRKSNGLNPAPGLTRELPAATAMAYYMGRLWYAQGRTYSAGDIVGGPNGTLAYAFRDSILKVTENPLAIGGDGFKVPTNAGNIRALGAEANLDAALGQGRLLVYTRKSIYALKVPITRADWIGATSNNQPEQSVVQINNGAVNDTSIVGVNGDQYFQSLEPAIRSFKTATRAFNQFGNKSISANVGRILGFNDRSLMRFSSGIEFDNRMLQTVLPRRVEQGVIHQAIVPLDFDPVSSLKDTVQGTSYPIWYGHWEGLDVLQLFTGDFGGLQRAFAMAISQVDGTFNLWDLTTYSRTENGDNRVTWQVEFPSFTFGKEFETKRLQAMELWLDKVFGTVNVDVYYRQDANPCWIFWGATEFCVARSCEENVNTPCGYPIQPFREGYKFPITFGKPPVGCAQGMKRPSDIGFQFQTRVVIKGWCRIRGILLYAQQFDRSLFGGMSC